MGLVPHYNMVQTWLSLLYNFTILLYNFGAGCTLHTWGMVYYRTASFIHGVVWPGVLNPIARYML